MIFRKPYAFLMKHFKLINLVLLFSILYSLNKVLNLHSFVKDYLNTGIYNVTLTPISNFINKYVYLILVITIIISGILFYLLKRKEKPFTTYAYILAVAFITLILSIYINNYFIYTATKTFNKQMVSLIRDLTLINSFLYYPSILILIIRALGIDLKNFGFYQDKEFIEINENDREEVEVEVTFDKHKYIRLFKNKLRYTKYFILEHVVPISIIFGLVVIFAGFNFYHYLYVENKIYKQNESFTSNYFKMNVNHAYLTDKDYVGNVVSSENRFFIMIELDIENQISDRTFDASRMFLYVDDKYYLPTTRYNNSFSDLGTLYEKDKEFPYRETRKVVLVYEVEKPEENANFLLKYQDIVSKDKKLIRVKVKIQDISSLKEKDSKRLTEELTVPINEQTSYTFALSNFEITDIKTYTTESCSGYYCPIIEKIVESSNNKTLVYAKVNTESIRNYLSFLKKYGKIRYKVGDKTYTENISFKITNYRGSHIYLEVSNLIKEASNIELVFTVRTYQYIYKIKGE